MNKCFFVISALIFSGSVLATDLTGKWTGKMMLDGSRLQKRLHDQSAKLTGERKKQVENRIRLINESIQVVDKTKIKMDIKKGGVAFVELNRNGKAEPEWCKWSLKGKKMTLTGFTGGGDSTMALTGIVTDSGKSLVFDMSSIIDRQMKSQGLTNAEKPRMTLTFKKT